MSAKVQKFLATVMSHFNKLHKSDTDEEAWMMSMIAGLKGYDATVLERAAQRILLTRKDPGFPYLSQCREACEEIIKIERAERTPKFDEASKRKSEIDGADHKHRLADELICAGELGRRAAREGWILSLHDFCRINGKLPTEDWQIRKCIDSAKGFDRAYEAVLNGEGGPCAKSLEALGDTMLKTREKKRALVLGRE